MISIIVPVYNSQTTLCTCVNSILNQNYHNIEVILVDDGSTDSSPLICDNFKNQDDRVIVIHKNNEGAGKARNDGLKIAKGDFIGFVDSDDFIDKSMYSTMISIAEASNADIVQCGHEKISESGNVLFRSNYLDTCVSSKEKCFEEYCKQNNVDNYSPTKIYRRNILRNTEFGNLSYSEDAIFIMNAFINCNVLVVINNPFYKYIQTSMSACRRPFNINVLDTVKAGEILYDKCCSVYPQFASYFALYTAKWARYCYCNVYMENIELANRLWGIYKNYYHKIKIFKHWNSLTLSLVLFRYFRTLYLVLKKF